MAGQNFGGPWSTTKESAIRNYLNAYSTALRNTFKIIYIDAFAGTGERVLRKNSDEDLFGDRINVTDGTAKIALKTPFPFSNYIFIDNKKKHCEELHGLKDDFPKRNVNIIRGDANEEVQKICLNTNWAGKRAVLLLDPFGMEVNWTTLQIIAKTEAIDLWYLFSIEGLFRNITINLKNINNDKRQRLIKMLGNDDWEKYFYNENKQEDLFGVSPDLIREQGTKYFDQYVTGRLKSIFPWVGEPIHIPKTGTHKFSLYLALANQKPAAIKLAQKLSKTMLK